MFFQDGLRPRGLWDSLSITYYITYYGVVPPLFFFGLHCCVQAFSSYGERALLFVVVCELLIVVASLVAEHGL